MTMRTRAHCRRCHQQRVIYVSQCHDNRCRSSSNRALQPRSQACLAHTSSPHPPTVHRPSGLTRPRRSTATYRPCTVRSAACPAADNRSTERTAARAARRRKRARLHRHAAADKCAIVRRAGAFPGCRL